MFGYVMKFQMILILSRLLMDTKADLSEDLSLKLNSFLTNIPQNKSLLDEVISSGSVNGFYSPGQFNDLVSLLNKQYPQYKGEFLKVIDYHEEYKYDLLNKFKGKQQWYSPQ